MAKSRPQEQAFDLKGDLQDKGGLTHYKSSLHVENQLFGDARQKAIRQLTLFEDFPIEKAEEQTRSITGLDFSLTALKALHGLSILLERTGHKGHYSLNKPTGIFGGKKQKTVALVHSWNDIFEAIGEKRRPDGRYTGHAIQIIKKAVLEELTTPQNICISQKKPGTKDRFEVIQGQVQVIDVVKHYDNLSEEEKLQVEGGETLIGKVGQMFITFHPLLLKEIETFYSLIPITLFQDIKQILPRYNGRVVPTFIKYLLTLNHTDHQIGRDKLAKKLKIDYLLNPIKKGSGRQVKRCIDEINKCIMVAEKLGFILSSREIKAPGGLVTYNFKLNPDTCHRVKSKTKRIEQNKSKKSS